MSKHHHKTQLEHRLKALSYVPGCSKEKDETSGVTNYFYKLPVLKALSGDLSDIDKFRMKIVWTIPEEIAGYSINFDIEKVGGAVGIVLFPIHFGPLEEAEVTFVEYRLFELSALNALKQVCQAFGGRGREAGIVCDPVRSKGNTPSDN